MRHRCLSTAAMAVTFGAAASVATYGICPNNSAIGRCVTVVELVVIGLSQRLRNRSRPSRVRVIFRVRSYWIPGAYASAVSEKRSAFFRLLKNKRFKGFCRKFSFESISGMLPRHDFGRQERESDDGGQLQGSPFPTGNHSHGRALVCGLPLELSACRRVLSQILLRRS
jgi:hypothetical protein